MLAAPPVAAQDAPAERSGRAAAEPQTAVLEDLARRKDAAAALSHFIRQGQPDAVTDRALALLGDTRSPEAFPVLAELSHHRRPAARQASYSAAARLRDPRVEPLLERGLHDTDTGVRNLCARALGERRAKPQLESLFRAFERGVGEAGPAIGRIADPAAVARLHGLLERTPLPPMLATYEVLLLRPDLDGATKLDIVAHLGELSTPHVQQFFARLMGPPYDWSTQLPVLRAMAAAAQRIGTRPAKVGAP